MRTNNNSSLSMLLHGEGASISAALVSGAKYQFEDLPYKEWRKPFGSDLKQLKIMDTDRISILQERFNDIFEKYNGSQNDIVNSPEYINLKKQIRGLSRQRRFEYERFLSKHSSPETAEKFLGAYTSDGSYRPWTPEERVVLSESNKIQAERDEILGIGKRSTYEGHHGKSISRMQYNDIEGMYDPDNVRIYTPKGHLDHGHNGNWNNTSDTAYTDITDRTKEIKYSEKESFEDKSDMDSIIGISLGIFFGSISAIIKYNELRKSPLPWNRKKSLAIAGSFISGAATGILPYMAINQINTPVDLFLENGLADIFNNGVIIGPDSFLDNLADASGDLIVIMSAITLRSLIQAGIDGNRLGYNQAFKSLGRTLGRTSLEQGGFFVIQLLLDNLTPIPDPVLGPLITMLRVSYSIGKITMSIKHRKKITQKKIYCLHDAAYSFFA